MINNQKPLQKQELYLPDEAEDQEEELSSNSKYNILIIIRNIFIILISIIFLILEIIIHIFIFFEYKEYEEKSNDFIKGLGTIFYALMAFCNIIASIIVGIPYFIFTKYERHYVFFIIILVVKLISIYTSIQIIDGVIDMIMYYIFETIYFIICLINIIIYAYLQKKYTFI